jgi:hypothetical protein
MTPAETHAAVLDGLRQLGHLAADAHADRWVNLDLRGIMLGERDGTPRPGPPAPPLDADVALAVQLRNSFGAVMRGRRRIIERHAPIDTPAGEFCRSCPMGLGDGSGRFRDWPCDEYRDAAADLLPASVP